MAFGVTTHCEFKDDVDDDTFATNVGGTVVTGASTWTPGANKLQVVVVASRQPTGSITNPTVSGHGLTYTEKVFVESVAKRGIWVFTALGASPTNGALTASFSIDQLAAWICVYEIDGIDTGDPTGVSATNTDESLKDSDTLTPVLPAFADANNMTFAAAYVEDGATSFNIESGFIEEFQAENTEQRITVATKSLEDDPTFTLVLSAGDLNSGVVAFEIKAAAGGLSPPEIITMLNRDKINPIRLM